MRQYELRLLPARRLLGRDIQSPKNRHSWAKKRACVSVGDNTGMSVLTDHQRAFKPVVKLVECPCPPVDYNESLPPGLYKVIGNPFCTAGAIVRYVARYRVKKWYCDDRMADKQNTTLTGMLSFTLNSLISKEHKATICSVEPSRFREEQRHRWYFSEHGEANQGAHLIRKAGNCQYAWILAWENVTRFCKFNHVQLPVPWAHTVRWRT